MKISHISLLIALCVTSTVAFAEDDGLDARTSLKVNRAKRHQAMEKSNTRSVNSTSKENMTEDPCKGIEIGNVYTDSNRGATPRENTVVVTGDVINIPSSKCR
jgi:hypothetical protein